MIEIEIAYTWVCIILGLLVVGEAIALLIGMNLSDSEEKKWLSLKNYLIVFIDTITGLLVLILIMINFNKNFSIAIIIILISTCVLHVYREIEYFTNPINKFCANIPLFIFNNIKLFLSILGIGIGIYIQYNLN